MPWTVLARLDVTRARADRTLYVLAGFLALVGLGLGWGVAHVESRSGVAALPALVSPVVGFLLALNGAVFAAESIPDDRASGRTRLSLALPHRRRDLVVGTAAGRGLVVAATGVLAVAVAAGTATVFGANVAVTPAVRLAAATGLFGATCVGPVVAVSALTRSGRLALALSLAVAGLVLAWGPVLRTVVDVVLGSADQPWLDTVASLWPYRTFVELATGNAGPEAVAVLAGWALLPLVLGAVALERGDL